MFGPPLPSILCSTLITLFTLGCTEQKGATPEKAPATPAPPAASAVASVAPARAATIAGIPVATFNLDDTKMLEAALAPLGYEPILGCGQSTVKGRSVKCVYGFHAVTVSLHKKAPKKVPNGYEDVSSYPNAVLVSDGQHVIVSAGFKGKVADAEAVVNALWDAKAKTFGGVKLGGLKALSDLKEPLATKGYVGNVLGSIDYALRKLEIVTSHDEGSKPEGTFYQDGKGDSVSVKLLAIEGGVPEGEEKKLLDALTAPKP